MPYICSRTSVNKTRLSGAAGAAHLVSIGKVNSERVLVVNDGRAQENAQRNNWRGDNHVGELVRLEPLGGEVATPATNQRPGGQDYQEAQRDEEGM